MTTAKVSWVDLVFALSETLDLAQPGRRHHQLRTAYLVWRLAEVAKLPEGRIRRLFAAAALHDLGAGSAEEEARHPEDPEEAILPHCLWGEFLFKRVPGLQVSATAVRHHHTPWRRLTGTVGAPDLLDAQLLHLADRLERAIRRDQYILHQEAGLKAGIRALAGRALHKEVVNLFLEVAGRGDFWLELESPVLPALLRRHGPLHGEQIDAGKAQALSELFFALTDFRSRYTATHAAGVVVCARRLGALARLEGADLARLELAAQLNDLDGLLLTGRILERSRPSREPVADQPANCQLLDTLRGAEDVKRIAARHRERQRLAGPGLDLLAKVLAVADVFTALAEQRPYRPNLTPGRIAGQLRALVGSHGLEPWVVALAATEAEALAEEVRLRQAQWAGQCRDRLRTSARAV